ncbi:hypothetical protein H7K45_10405 [Mycobacterium yunnanensis]|uniref:Uncharacterized protein n=1 Tax=Mycobacterium yunnanensis TaxID=368477 RepID=A0A9X3BST8_9MYCO|nr:hypothetical protein [Mycobacterium yunnanensis]MCV7420949.1 hypothetical protein [Mycobacterium yunnanensis]
MTEKRMQTEGLRVKVLGLAGAAAFVTLGILSLGGGHSTTGGVDLAGSGDAPASTTYVQPTENAMTMGATATWTTPTSVEPIAKASPAKTG